MSVLYVDSIDTNAIHVEKIKKNRHVCFMCRLKRHDTFLFSTLKTLTYFDKTSINL